MSHTKKALLVGSSYSAIPLLKILNKLDIDVAVCGYLKEDPCHLYTNQSFYLDYSDKNQLLKLCEKENFDYIIPSCNDVAYLSCSYVANKLNLPYGFDSYKVSKLLHTKSLFRQYAHTNDFQNPKVITDSELENNKLSDNQFPLLMKPNNGHSGRGIIKITSQKQLNKILLNVDKSKNTFEEFIEGSLHSQSAFIQNGKITIDFFVDEFCSTCPYQVDSSCLSTSLTEEMSKKVRNNIKKLIKKLDLCDGLIHTQFIINNNDVWLVEAMRRSPGDLYGTLIKKSTNMDYWLFYIYPFLGKKIAINKGFDTNKFITRYSISSEKNISFSSFSCDLPNQKTQVFPLKNSGAYLKKAPFDKLGILFAEFENYQDMINSTPKISKYVKINEI